MNLLIIGAGGHGKVVKEAAEALKIYNRIDFLDDNSELAIGRVDEYEKFSNVYQYAFVAIGNAEIRNELVHKLSVLYSIPSIIHPTAYVSTSVQLGTGCYVGTKSVLNTNSHIKDGCIIGIGALIDHDCVVGEYSYVNAGAIVKAGCRVDRFRKIDTGVVYSDQ
ncbi:PglD-related sugar-binding protein [Clostridium sp. DL1XJH146]